MNILVSQTDYAHLWKYDNGQVTKLTLRNFHTHILSPTGTPLVDATILPPELKTKIIFINFMMMLKDYNFQEAADLLVDRLTVKTIYMELFRPGKAIVSINGMIVRIYRTLHLLESIYDDYLTVPNYGRIEHVALRFTHRGLLGAARNTVLNPWDFRCNIRLEEFDTDVESKVFLGGPDLGDSILIGGACDNGVIMAKTIHHPVITIILCDKTDVLLPIESNFWRNKNFICFSRLLRKVFGPHSGVFYMCRRNGDHDNVFITSSDMIVSL